MADLEQGYILRLRGGGGVKCMNSPGRHAYAVDVGWGPNLRGRCNSGFVTSRRHGQSITRQSSSESGTLKHTVLTVLIRVESIMTG